jgi:hypothetical protein
MPISRRACVVWAATGLLLPGALFRTAWSQDRKPQVIDVRIAKRKVVAPRGAIRVTEQDVIELRFSSDEKVKLHLHGYDKELEVTPGVPATLSITTHATGRFPITSHGWGRGGHGHHALTYLEVHPR